MERKTAGQKRKAAAAGAEGSASAAKQPRQWWEEEQAHAADDDDDVAYYREEARPAACPDAARGFKGLLKSSRRGAPSLSQDACCRALRIAQRTRWLHGL